MSKCKKKTYYLFCLLHKYSPSVKNGKNITEKHRRSHLVSIFVNNIQVLEFVNSF